MTGIQFALILGGRVVVMDNVPTRIVLESINSRMLRGYHPT